MTQTIKIAQDLIKEGKNVEALKLLDEFAQQGQGDILAERLRAFAHYNLSKYQLAVDILQKAVMNAPEKINLYMDMVACYGALGDERMVDKTLDIAVSLSKEEIVSFVLQNINSNLGGMKRLIMMAMDRYPNNLDIFKAMVMLLDKHKMYNDALNYANKAVAINKISAYWRLVQAQLYLKVNQGIQSKEKELAEATQLISIILDVQKHTAAFMIKDDIQVVFTYALEYDRYKAVTDIKYWQDYWINCPSVIPLMYQMDRVQTMQDRLDVLELHRLWGERISKDAPPIKQKVRSKINSKIRIGIMDAFEDTHVGRLLMPLIECWNKDGFELYCYEVGGMGRKGSLHHSAKNKADNFRDGIRSASNIEVAQVIADDGLDVLIDIGVGLSKPEIITSKPAAVQISWLDYPHSSGLAMDYLMVDKYIKPEANMLLEKPLVLPHTWVVMDKALVQAHEITNLIPEDKNGYITFGTMNSIYKFSPKTFKVWAEIMLAVPNSKFIYARVEKLSQIFRDNFVKYMAVHGIDPSRIIFRSTVTTTHMEEYNNIDIALDTFPRTGGTTTCESLWMGVPVVTLVGPAFFERLSYSNLNNVGLGDLCAASIEEYKKIALKLTMDKERRRNLRHNLRQVLLQSPLGQTEQFAQDFTATIANALGRG